MAGMADNGSGVIQPAALNEMAASASSENSA